VNCQDPEVFEMFIVTENAVERVSEELVRSKYNLKELFNRIKKENPKVAEYIKSQADKSKHPMEVYGTGIVVYLLLRMQVEIDDEGIFAASEEDVENFREFLDTTDLTDLLEN
jgi:Ribonuclease G/E